MANSLSFTDISQLLNTIHGIVTGKNTIAPVNTNEFVNVATTTLMQGYDPVLKAISQVMANTIMSIRPYYRKFRDLEVTNEQWGNHTRKLQMLDTEWDGDVTYNLVDGQAVDMYKIKTDAVLQTNFYGINSFARYITIWKQQLNSAFKSPEELARFMSMKMQNLLDMIEQTKESTSRLTVANYIAGKLTVDPTNVLHLVTEYNSYLGLSDDEAFTSETIKMPNNWPNFVYWAFGRMMTVSDMLTERLATHHQQLTVPEDAKGGTLMRHTPYQDQRAYFLSPELNHIGTQVRTITYNEEFLKLIKSEKVNFWQSPSAPASISVIPSYTGADGTVKKTAAAVTMSEVFGLLHDVEAMGMTTVWDEFGPTPYNIAGSYSNLYAKYALKWWNDWTENSVVFVLD